MLSAFLFLSLWAASCVPIPTGIVNTAYGPVQGLIEEEVQVYHRIPFAAPPVGDLRFKAPQPPQKWNETLVGDAPPNPCPQFDTQDRFIGHEDCLYLNVFVPVKPPKEKRPVFFWIYGGAYVVGDSWEFGKYDGKNASKKYDAIVVTHNYRVGALGFMALDELKAESPTGSTGNYALQDQRFALQWVRDNIEAFGGDPTQITILGESAGAISVCAHLASPASRGLFRSAVMESGTCDTLLFFVDYNSSKTWSQIHANSTGCDPNDSANLLSCLRGLNTSHVAFVHKNLYHVPGIPLCYPLMPWAPTVDGSVDGLPGVPGDLLREGKGNYVPLIAGTNNNEGSIFVVPIRVMVPSVKQPLQEDDVPAVLNHFFCNNDTIVQTIMNAYPNANYKNPDHQVAMMIRDWFFVCPTRRAHSAMWTYNPKSSWMYHFTYVMRWPLNDAFGDYHSSELNFMFNNQWPLGLKAWNDTDYQMGDTFGIYWGNLIWNSDVNGAHAKVPLQWPYWDPTNEQNLVMTVPVSTETHYTDSTCDMWDNVHFNLCTYCGCS